MPLRHVVARGRDEHEPFTGRFDHTDEETLIGFFINQLILGRVITQPMFENLDRAMIFVQHIIENGLIVIGPFKRVIGIGDGFAQ